MKVSTGAESYFLLKKYYFVVQISGLLALFSFGLLAYLFPHQFSFFGSSWTFFKLVIFWFIYHAVLFFFHYKTKQNIFFTLSRYGWIAFFFAIILLSGGSKSPVLYLLIFPLLVAGVNLDKKDIKYVSGVIALFFIGLLLGELVAGNKLNLGLALFNLSVFSTVSYYIYTIVGDTLSEKFEKEKAKSELESLIQFDRVKKEFITVASHQLRTPLSGARWALKEGIEHHDSDCHESLLEAKKLVDKSIDVVNELLSAIEYNERNIKLNKESVNICNFIKEIILDIQPLIRSKKVQLSYGSDCEYEIEVDQKIMEVSLRHVIENAVKYSPNGKVIVKVDKVENELKITIEDNGIGIPQKDMPYIFEPSYRAQNAVDLEPNQSGIGLYTAKRIIELHNGSIKIESEIEKGTKVKIELKLS